MLFQSGPVKCFLGEMSTASIMSIEMGSFSVSSFNVTLGDTYVRAQLIRPSLCIL